VTHSEAKNQTRPHTRSHPVRTVRILRPLASTPTHRGADGAAVCIPLWDRRVASKKWRCSARRPGRVEIHRTKGADRLDSVPPQWSTPLVCLLRPKDDSGGHERTTGFPPAIDRRRSIRHRTEALTRLNGQTPGCRPKVNQVGWPLRAANRTTLPDISAIPHDRLIARPGKGRYARRASWSDEWRATFRTFTSDEFGTTAHLSNFEFPACWHRKLNGSTVRWGRFDTPALERLGA
jgi:hypothetical protein